MGPEYHAEVSLKTRIPGEGYVLQVEGRADGIIIREQEEEPDVTIDEIKGVFRIWNIWKRRSMSILPRQNVMRISMQSRIICQRSVSR